MKRILIIGMTGILTTAGAIAATSAPASAEGMARGVSTCAQLHQQHPTGIAKSKKAAKAAKRAGYKKPFVCKYVYLQLRALDGNGNRSVCEVSR